MQVVHTQVDGAQAREVLQTLLDRFMRITRADGVHHRQATHGIQRGADHAAVDAIVAIMADQLGAHLQHGFADQRGAAGGAQAEQLVEGDLFFEDLDRSTQELLLQNDLGQLVEGKGTGGCYHDGMSCLGMIAIVSNCRQRRRCLS